MEIEIRNRYKHFWNCLKKNKEAVLIAVEEESKCSGP